MPHAKLPSRKLFTIVPAAIDKTLFVWYIITMKRENWLNVLRQRDKDKARLSIHTYELWFLGDRHHILRKNRDSLNTLLKEAHQMLTDAAAVGGVVGEAEIVHRWGEHGQHDETVWSMSIDEFTKGHRLPIKAL